MVSPFCRSASPALFPGIADPGLVHPVHWGARSCAQAINGCRRKRRLPLHACSGLFRIPGNRLRTTSKSLFQNKGMVSAKHEAEKPDFSNIVIEILDVVSLMRLRAPIANPQI
jgi:hypothetical protein